MYFGDGRHVQSIVNTSNSLCFQVSTEIVLCIDLGTDLEVISRGSGVSWRAFGGIWSIIFRSNFLRTFLEPHKEGSKGQADHASKLGKPELT